MSDPTKNLPWRVEYHRAEFDLSERWVVADSTGSRIVTFYAESLARMVAAGSEAVALQEENNRLKCAHSDSVDAVQKHYEAELAAESAHADELATTLRVCLNAARECKTGAVAEVVLAKHAERRKDQA